MSSPSQIALAAFVMLSLIYESQSIQCFYCNSANNSACLDLKLLDEETRSRLIPSVTCEEAVPTFQSVNFFCRKIVQNIYHPHHESELRVTRGCGWVRHHQECYRADNMDHQETVCQCFHDHCNSGERVDPAVATFLFLVFSCVLYFYR